MSMRLLLAAGFALASTAPLVQAADPAGAELNDDSLKLEWAGSGPYIVPNLTPFVGEPVPIVCEPALMVTCDEFALSVNISEEFRDLPENQRESVKISASFPVTTSLEDYDMYVVDGSGAVIAESAGLMGVQESVTVPLKTLKNGSYIVRVIPFTPMATNYSGQAQIGKDAPASQAGMLVSPLVGAAPLLITADARGLGQGSAPAGGYVFDFGDGSAPVTDADGVVEHTYTQNGQYLTRVHFSDARGGKTLAGGSQTVFVGAIGGSKSGTSAGGALGFSTLLGLFAALAAAARRTRS